MMSFDENTVQISMLADYLLNGGLHDVGNVFWFLAAGRRDSPCPQSGAIFYCICNCSLITITNSLDNHEATAGVFIDLKKAFDTVDHSILIEKLYHYGIRGTANQLICSYLMNIYQYVTINGTN